MPKKIKTPGDGGKKLYPNLLPVKHITKKTMKVSIFDSEQEIRLRFTDNEGKEFTPTGHAATLFHEDLRNTIAQAEVQLSRRATTIFGAYPRLWLQDKPDASGEPQTAQDTAKIITPAPDAEQQKILSKLDDDFEKNASLGNLGIDLSNQANGDDTQPKDTANDTTSVEKSGV